MSDKAISYDKLRRRVDKALLEKFGHTVVDEGYTYQSGAFLAELFDEYVIADIDDVYYQIPYTDSDDGVEFAGREDWVKVEPQRVWIEAKARWLAARLDIDLPCAQKAIKVLDRDTRRIGAYATVWGEVDCDKDRMTKGAIEPYLGKGAPYMFWLHGLDKEFGANTVGTWDTTSFKNDTKGLFVEGNVSFDDYGNKAWERINKAGAFGLSVGSIWYLVKKKNLSDGTKEITDWPLLDISLMEGGKQCVPSARRDIKAEMETAYRAMALKMGLDTDHTQDGGAVSEYQISLEKGAIKMDPKDQATVNIEQMVAKQIEAVLAAKAAQEEAVRKQQEAIEAKAIELTAVEVAKAQVKFDDEKKRLEGELEKALKARQPLAPVTADGKSQPFIQVFSPYDRLPTMDLAVRYQVMKSYGMRPSEKFFRALAGRAVKMAREEDTLYIKNGQPVKAPAIDWENLIPRNLDLSEVNGEIKAGKIGEEAKDVVTPLGLKQLAELAIKSDELVYSTQASYGDEWVPTLMTADLWRTIRLNAAVLGQFEQFDMPSQPYDYPIESTDPTFYKVGEAADESQLILTGGPFADSKIGTAKVTFTAGKIGAITYWSEEAEEDAIIAIEPQFRDQYGIKVAHVVDEVLLSAHESTSTANISYYGSDIDDASHLVVIDGLRRQPLVTTTTDARSGSTLTVDDFGATQALMGTGGKFGVNPNDLVFFLDTGVWHKAKMLSEVLTVDRFGSMATIVTGQLGALFGAPLIVSEDYGLTDSSGYINASAGSNTYGSFLCVNKRGVKVGWRRRPRIRVVGIPGSEARYIVCSARFDIGFKEAGMVALTYAVTI